MVLGQVDEVREGSDCENTPNTSCVEPSTVQFFVTESEVGAIIHTESTVYFSTETSLGRLYEIKVTVATKCCTGFTLCSINMLAGQINLILKKKKTTTLECDHLQLF